MFYPKIVLTLKLILEKGLGDFMSDFPILKWVNVDGRSVPFTYPQHKKDGGYVETGDENPLPVGNHVMSEGGLWIPEPEVRSTQLTGSYVEYRKVETILPRAIYSSRFNDAVFEQPKWANSAVFYLILYGSSGQFGGGEGASLQTILFGSDSARYYGVTHEGVDISGALQVTEWGADVNDDNIETPFQASTSYKAVPISFVSDLNESRVRVFITGTFEEGEGIDCEIKVAWLRG